MREERLFDEIARSLASPMPRREALRKILGGLAGAALATIALPGRAQAAPKTCKNDGDCGGNGSYCCNKKVCCAAGEVCCGAGANALCCSAGSTCCGNGANTICCPPGTRCTGNGNKVTCTNVSPS